MKRFLLAVLVIAGLFGFDYAFDWPSLILMPEIWTCATLEQIEKGIENAWFQRCWP